MIQNSHLSSSTCVVFFFSSILVVLLGVFSILDSVAFTYLITNLKKFLHPFFGKKKNPYSLYDFPLVIVTDS